MIDFLRSFMAIALELTVLFVMISFLIQLLQRLIPYDKVEKLLHGRNKLRSLLVAVVFAFVTPFCSCSTIPVVVTLLKKNIPFSIVMTFLFASPVLDPTILTVMGVVMGWKVTFLYTIVTVTFSIMIGVTLEKLGFEKYVKHVMVKGDNQLPGTSLSAWQETWSMMKSVYPYLLLGSAIGAVIHGVVPTDFVVKWFGHDAWWLIPVAALVGIPLYIRLSSMIPISQMLIVKGMALGPVMAMMISSAGASLPEVVLLKSIFHKQLVLAFVVSVLLMSTLSGFIFHLY